MATNYVPADLKQVGRSLSRWILIKLQARTQHHALNENVPPGSFPNSDSPIALMLVKHSCSTLINPADLLSRSRSSFLPQIERERLVGRITSRTRLRRTRRCPCADQLVALSIAQATCSQLFPSPHRDPYQHGAWECLFALPD